MERQLIEPISASIDALRQVDRKAFDEGDLNRFRSWSGVNELLHTLVTQVPELRRRIQDAEKLRQTSNTMYEGAFGGVAGVGSVLIVVAVALGAYLGWQSWVRDQGPQRLLTVSGISLMIVLLSGMGIEVAKRVKDHFVMANDATSQVTLGPQTALLASLLPGSVQHLDLTEGGGLQSVKREEACEGPTTPGSNAFLTALYEQQAGLCPKESPDAKWRSGGGEHLRAQLRSLKDEIGALEADVRSMDIMRSTQDLRASVRYLQSFVLRAAARPLPGEGAVDEDAAPAEVVREALVPKFVAVPNVGATDAAWKAAVVLPATSARTCVDACASDPTCKMCQYARGQCRKFTGANVDLQVSLPSLLGEQHAVLMTDHGADQVTVTGTPASRDALDQGVEQCQGGSCGTYVNRWQDPATKRYITPGQAGRLTFVGDDADNPPVTLTQPFDGFIATAAGKHLAYTLRTYSEVLTDKLVRTGLDVSRPGLRANVHAVLVKALGADAASYPSKEYDAIMDMAVEQRGSPPPAATAPVADGAFLSLAEFRARLSRISQQEYTGRFSESIKTARLSMERVKARYGFESLDVRMTGQEIDIKRALVRWAVTLAVVSLLFFTAYQLLKSWDAKALGALTLQTLLILAVGLMPIVFLASTAVSALERRDAYKDYNQTVMHDNADTLVRAIRRVADVDASARLVNGGEEGAKLVSLPPEKDAEVIALYAGLKDVVTAFTRCNSVNALGGVKVPVQISDVVVDGIFLAALAAVAVYVVYRFDFLERVWDLRWMLRAKSKLRRYVDVPSAELVFYLDRAIIPEELKSTLKYSSVMLLFLGVLTYASYNSTNARLIKPGLFNSALYADRRCAS